MMPLAWAALDRLDPDAVRAALHAILAQRSYRFARGSEAEQAWLQKLFDLWFRFRDWMSALSDRSPVWYWAIVLCLLAVLGAAIFHLAYTIRSGSRRHPERADAAGEPDAVAPERALREAADEAARRGDHLAALRALFRLLLLRYREKHPGRLLRGLTNRECARLWGADPARADAMQRLVALLDAKWYGGQRCSEAEYAAMRSVCEDLLRRIP